MRSLSRRHLLGLVSLSPAAWVAPAFAQDPVNPPPASCPAPPRMATIGVAAGQALRVSLFRHVDPGGLMGPVDFRIDVFGLGGQPLGSDAGLLAPGQGAFADFDVAKGLQKGQRVQVHVNVTVPSGYLVGATAEVFDLKTGETRMPRDPCLEPEPFAQVMGTVGLVRGQIVRVSLFHHLDLNQAIHACSFKFALTGLDGKLLATDTGQILPGQGVAFDVDLVAGAGLKNSQRLQFHGDVSVEHPDLVGSLLEIVDVKTGETRYPVSPSTMPLVVP